MLKIINKKYTIPFYNNKKCYPYGYIIIEDENKKQYKRYYELNKKDVFIFNKVKYKLINNGSLYEPLLLLVLLNK